MASKKPVTASKSKSAKSGSASSKGKVESKTPAAKAKAPAVSKATKPAAKSAAKPAAKAPAKAAAKPAAKPVTKAAAKAPAKAQAKAPAKAVAKAVAKPAAKAAVKAPAKPAAKPAAKVAAKPAAKAPAKPAAKVAAKPVAKPAAKAPEKAKAAPVTSAKLPEKASAKTVASDKKPAEAAKPAAKDAIKAAAPAKPAKMEDTPKMEASTKTAAKASSKKKAVAPEPTAAPDVATEAAPKAATKAAPKAKAPAKPKATKSTKAAKAVPEPVARLSPLRLAAGSSAGPSVIPPYVKEEVVRSAYGKPASAAAIAKAAERPVAKPGSNRSGFKQSEFIVYPAHGVGQIVAIEEQEVAGFKLELFVINFMKDKMTLKVPLPKVLAGAIRKLADAETVQKALDTLTGRARIKRTMWSRRAQEYEAKINSGDLQAIAEVVRDLYRSDAQPEQSYSERQLYEAALDRMAREIAAVQKLSDMESLKLIDSQLQKGPRRGAKVDVEVDAADEGDAEPDEGETSGGVEEAA